MLGNIVMSRHGFAHHALLQATPEEAWVGPHLRTTFSPAQPRSRLSATFSQATTASSWGFREQGGQARPLLPSPLKPLSDKK